jgi:hypothetical protein
VPGSGLLAAVLKEFAQRLMHRGIGVLCEHHSPTDLRQVARVEALAGSEDCVGGPLVRPPQFVEMDAVDLFATRPLRHVLRREGREKVRTGHCVHAIENEEFLGHRPPFRPGARSRRSAAKPIVGTEPWTA